VLFDFNFVPKPNIPGPKQPEWWGGYIVEFKLAEAGVFERHNGDIDALRRNAAVLGPAQKRTYSIDISKNEYCAGKVKKQVDDYTIYVYSLEMIAIEKLRAICQQMPEYEITAHKSPRARDFYDIYQILQCENVDLTTSTNRELFNHIFSAKKVPLELLGNIGQHKAFHEPDWPSVDASISGSRERFDFYFDFVLRLVSSLRPGG
jgi:hypothetical protein